MEEANKRLKAAKEKLDQQKQPKGDDKLPKDSEKKGGEGNGSKKDES